MNAGTPLRGVLEEAGLLDDVVEAVFTGSDCGLDQGVERDYQRSLPVAEALRDDVLPAYAIHVRAGATRVEGRGWSRRGPIRRVEFSADGGRTWADAGLDEPLGPHGWTGWSYVWDAREPGDYELWPRCLEAGTPSARELRRVRVRGCDPAAAPCRRTRDHGGVPRALVVAPMLAAIAVAGGALPAAGGGGVEEPDSGVRGVVLPRSPCPVILERDRCGDQPRRRASIVIRRAHHREWVATVRTDARGRFRKALEPGTYVFELQRAAPGGPSRTLAKRVVVPPHRFVAVILG